MKVENGWIGILVSFASMFEFYMYLLSLFVIHVARPLLELNVEGFNSLPREHLVL